MKEDTPLPEHILIPDHILLTYEEAQQILSKHNISIGQLPKISRKDPAIKHLDTKTGDIIKIVRKSVTAGISIYYRMIYD